jgi:hypothetical protein
MPRDRAEIRVVHGDDRLQPRLRVVEERDLFVLVEFLVAENGHG